MSTIFSTDEVRVQKAHNCNVLHFSVPAHSSLLLSLRPRISHEYKQRNDEWLKLLEEIAEIPSRQLNRLVINIDKVFQCLPNAKLENQLHKQLDILLDKAKKHSKDEVSNIGLLIKDNVTTFLRSWMKDPIEGCVYWHDHVVAGYRRDEEVSTPLGNGFIRDYRKEDNFCIILYSFGYGLIHISYIQSLKNINPPPHKRRRLNMSMSTNLEDITENKQLDQDIKDLEEDFIKSGYGTLEQDSDSMHVENIIQRLHHASSTLPVVSDSLEEITSNQGDENGIEIESEGEGEGE